MSREGALTVMIVVAVLLLAVLAWAWWRRSRRDGAPLVAPGELPQGAAVVASFDGFYVATTHHDQPLERIAAPGLAMRSKVSVTVADAGVALDLTGQPRYVIARDAITGVGQSTVAIDRVVEKDGLTRISWRALTGDVVDTYLRPQGASARALTDAVAGIIPQTATGTEA
ncbi:hypothetical protein ACFQRL_05480 [Microbacterium fluvii]|uniref:PH domain-containing protein n=1 Tax=Microbacterium fluvii TaxID=415215 RepID=A0ABW2HG37_9MICO|nr:hypothetical protein [Microbacterium fluvii]MCU4672038.1 hypothetical protein [Microbacterium fluvii]